ncbi:NADH-quinone oxidoreductase subunit NuoN [Nocardioides sp. CER19]|uniref:NADH-quinone oxidoreductase subunit NuoN n=1 Tax=Nocardioides sp. CER19 TaxID=3038538 RepID=UPI00244BCA7A|nr:NADH-quinone oxidoreductase subunit NuoN [Nocardioides sp. CER19]MDH2414297.1 NADH-quinone oxidoreductase subunit NuoN [Nocardioides sp. CER19]
MNFTQPHIEYAQLWPLFVVFGVACAGVLVEAFVPRQNRYLTQIGLTVVGLVVALAGTVYVGVNLDALQGARGLVGAEGALAVDGPSVYLWGLVLVCAIGGALLFAERRVEGGVTVFAGQAAALPGTTAEREASTRGLEHTEVYPLLLFAVFGMMLFPAANDLIMLFAALEVLSLPLYLLCGLARRRRLLSQEAALKYFLLGAFSSGFFLYGLALVYGYAGTMQFSGIAAAVQGDWANHSLLLIGVGMMSVGLLFKVGAVPFHSWTPDVYQGAPTAVTAFMSAATKIAAFGAFLRLFYVAFGADRWSWQPMLWVVAILTMIVGAVVAVVQTDVKRMLAYSSIAHTGFLLTGLLGVQAAGDLGKGEISSLEAVLFYLTTYGLAIVGSFALVSVVRDAGGETSRFAAWAGLGRRAPLTAAVFAYFLLSMAGIPLTAGFIGKWAVFSVALSAGAWPVVIVAIASSIVAVFFYVRFILLMFFTDRETEGAAAVTAASPLTTGVIAVTAIATLVLGIVPGPVLDLVHHAGSFIR